MLRHGRYQDASIFVADERFGAAGANIDTKEIGHGDSSKFGHGSIVEIPCPVQTLFIQTPEAMSNWWPRSTAAMRPLSMGFTTVIAIGWRAWRSDSAATRPTHWTFFRKPFSICIA